MKRTFAIILAACLLLALASGCSQTDVGGTSGVIASSEPTQSAAVSSLDYDAAYKAHKPDEVVLTVDGSEVTWAEYYYWMYYVGMTIETQLGAIEDLDAVFPYGDGTQTYGEYISDGAYNMVVQYHALDVCAREAGIELTDEDRATLEDMRKSDVASVCGEGATEEEFYEAMAAEFVTPEVYNAINETSVLYDRAFTELYGKNGEKLPAEEVLSYAEDAGYVTVKHILLSTVDTEGEALPDDEKKEKLTLAQSIYDEIAAISDPAAREARFDELTAKYTEDSGYAYFPDGYCFTQGTMVTEFDEAARALAQYEVSEPIESSYGYHIILRLPTTADDLVYSTGASALNTLGYYAAQSAYSVIVGAWVEEAEVDVAPAFEDFSASALFS